MKTLNWEPVVSRKKGLENTFNYFKNLSLDELNKKITDLDNIFASGSFFDN